MSLSEFQKEMQESMDDLSEDIIPELFEQQLEDLIKKGAYAIDNTNGKLFEELKLKENQ